VDQRTHYTDNHVSSQYIGLIFLFVFVSFFVGLGFELRALHCKAGVLLLEPHLQPILL
jgi:hypothetical protein